MTVMVSSSLFGQIIERTSRLSSISRNDLQGFLPAGKGSVGSSFQL